MGKIVPENLKHVQNTLMVSFLNMQKCVVTENNIFFF